MAFTHALYPAWWPQHQVIGFVYFSRVFSSSVIPGSRLSKADRCYTGLARSRPSSTRRGVTWCVFRARPRKNGHLAWGNYVQRNMCGREVSAGISKEAGVREEVYPGKTHPGGSRGPGLVQRGQKTSWRSPSHGHTPWLGHQDNQMGASGHSFSNVRGACLWSGGPCQGVALQRELVDREWPNATEASSLGAMWTVRRGLCRRCRHLTPSDLMVPLHPGGHLSAL